MICEEPRGRQGGPDELRHSLGSVPPHELQVADFELPVQCRELRGGDLGQPGPHGAGLEHRRHQRRPQVLADLVHAEPALDSPHQQGVLHWQEVRQHVGEVLDHRKLDQAVVLQYELELPVGHQDLPQLASDPHALPEVHVPGVVGVEPE